MKELSIRYTCNIRARFSVWRCDEAWLHPGETATIYGCLVADPENPLWQIRRDSDGDTRVLYQSRLLAYGTIEGVD